MNVRMMIFFRLNWKSLLATAMADPLAARAAHRRDPNRQPRRPFAARRGHAEARRPDSRRRYARHGQAARAHWRKDADAALRRPQSEAERERIVAMLGDRAVALVSDAGTPLISDPGYKLVRAARAAGHAVHTVPGPSAAIAALTLAGLPTDRFLFLGFLPAKAKARADTIAEIAAIRATLVFYESGPRLGDTLGGACRRSRRSRRRSRAGNHQAARGMRHRARSRNWPHAMPMQLHRRAKS